MSNSPPQASPPQFSLGMIFVVMLAVSISVAPGYYFLRAQQGVPGMHLVAMLMVLSGPLLLMVALHVVYSVYRWLRNR